MQDRKKKKATRWTDGKIRCGGRGLGGAAITGSYTRFAQRTACTRSGAMSRDRDAKQKSKTGAARPKWARCNNGRAGSGWLNTATKSMRQIIRWGNHRIIHAFCPADCMHEVRGYEARSRSQDWTHDNQTNEWTIKPSWTKTRAKDGPGLIKCESR